MHTNRQVLIIDDEPYNILSLKATLKARGYICHEASSAYSAMALLEQCHEIGIILFDVMMPDVDGLTFVHMLKQHTRLKTIPTIAVTAKAMKGDKEQILAAGADEYVSKPIDVDLLLGYLNKYIN